jgi:hypothetical protein
MDTKQTVRELRPALGAEVIVRFEQLSIACVVLDAKSSYGRERLLIQPLIGCGTQWVELSRITGRHTRDSLAIAV